MRRQRPLTSGPPDIFPHSGDARTRTIPAPRGAIARIKSSLHVRPPEPTGQPAMHAPSVSIIICTRNRAESLRETLGSMLCCTAPEGEAVEIVVVDNGSTDHTQAVVLELVGLLGATAPHGRFELRYVVEPLPGQAHARNRGMAEARGDLLLWTDDDVRVPTSWIVEMTRPLRCGDADAVAGEVKIPPHLAARTRDEPGIARRDFGNSRGHDLRRNRCFLERDHGGLDIRRVNRGDGFRVLRECRAHQHGARDAHRAHLC